MSTVLDASALLSLLLDEPGAEVVQNLVSRTEACYVHALNLCEVYYHFWRVSSQEAAESAITDLMTFGIEERDDMDSQFWREVGHLKAVYRRVSLADCCALVLAKKLGATLVSADRHEFEPLLAVGICKIELIR
ncbi:MAG TPA: PIN domain-containing protein [Bryobacteraceae bacterium]|nr:PIN domain-containing protein [Bryobacteraceae bacterium]